MTEKAVETKAEALPDLDDLLQCPVCYEIPSGQIFQCNEGHHVCGTCKARLDVCPVCRAFFFGTRNYAMEELIANIRRLRAFKLGGKVTTGNTSPERQSEAKESSEENESTNNEEDDDHLSSISANRTFVEPPRPCSGLFRCLCCKINPERLPSGRLLNHLRYFHSPDLIEGRSDEHGEYIQAWQFATDIGRIVTAVRVGDMGVFFLVIEITHDSICSWLVMAASPRVAEEFCYTFTLSGNDREAIFSDVVWSVRTCEGFLKKRLRCLSVSGGDARSLLAPNAMSAKLRLRRTPLDVGPHQVQPRAVMRVANRSTRGEEELALAAATVPSPPRSPTPPADAVVQGIEPFLQDLQNDVARLSLAFATLGREASALARSEAEMRVRLETALAVPEEPQAAEPEPATAAPLSRNARRRMRQRMRQAFRETQTADDPAPPARALQAGDVRQTNGQTPNTLQNNSRVQNDQTVGDRANSQGGQNTSNTARANRNVAVNTRRSQNDQGDRTNNNLDRENIVYRNMTVHTPVGTARAPLPTSALAAAAMSCVPTSPAPALAPDAPADTPNGTASAGTGRNKKKRRQRR